MDKTTCDLCGEWRGAANDYPRHLAEDCSATREAGAASGGPGVSATDGRQETLRADGGQYALPSVGDRVQDREAVGAEEDELVVVKVRDTRADKYEIAAVDGATVAELNRKYDPEAPVVDAVYVEEADNKLDGWRSVEDLRDAVTFGAITSYSFPADRLVAIPGGVGE
jgi:hypothetical protein